MCVCLVHRVLGFQKRWVRLDADYLRYFEKDKVTTAGDRKHSPTEPHLLNVDNVCVCVCVL